MRFMKGWISVRVYSSLAVLVLSFVSAEAGVAYVGPGLGAGTIGVILGAVAAVFLALFAVIWYPVKRVMKKRRAAKKRTTE
jgi:hypothetical protein